MDWEERMWRAPRPDGPTEVWPGLWVGGCDGEAAGYDVVLTLTENWEGRPPPARRPARHVRYPMRDSRRADELDVAGLAEVVAGVARWVRDGKKVLVRCWLGLNRSGLVAALAVCELSGADGPTVTRWLRERRSPQVLCNPTFGRLVAAVPGRDASWRTSFA